MTRALLLLLLALTPLGAIAQDAPALEPGVCEAAQTGGMAEGAASVGYLQADFATGRRACPRTEVGLGVHGGAIIDVANFYGDLGGEGLLSGSWALTKRWELYATLEAVHFTYLQTAFKATSLTLGNLTVGATWTAYQRPAFAGALSARLLLPTSFAIPNARTIGAEVGHASTWRPLTWLEVHSWLGVDLTAGLSFAEALPRVGGTLSVGAQLRPFSWGALVLDLTGRLGPVSYLAPTLALRFEFGALGLELGGSLPLAGTDRHDFLGALRVSWRFK